MWNGRVGRVGRIGRIGRIGRMGRVRGSRFSGEPSTSPQRPVNDVRISLKVVLGRIAAAANRGSGW